MSPMLRPSWARLTAAFSPSPSAWVLRELSPDRNTAKVAPVPAAEAIRSRLDEVATPDGWSFQLLPLGDRAIVCNLTVDGVGRSGVYQLPQGAVIGSALASAEAIADGALAAAAANFGMKVDAPERWVDHDPETGEVLLDSGDCVEDGPVPAPVAGAHGTASARDDYHPAAPQEERPEAHQVIDRIVERLKAEGLGAQAAKLVVEYGGYGRDAEESRELYGRLRALLVHKVAVPS